MAYSGPFQELYRSVVVRQKRSDAALKTYASVEDARAYSMDGRERAMLLEEVVKGKSGESTCGASEAQSPNFKGASDGQTKVVSVEVLQKELKVFSSLEVWAHC